MPAIYLKRKDDQYFQTILLAISAKKRRHETNGRYSNNKTIFEDIQIKIIVDKL